MPYETGFIHRYGWEWLNRGDTMHSVVPVAGDKRELRIINVLSVERVPVKHNPTRQCTRIGYRVVGVPVT